MIFDDHDIRDDWNASLDWKRKMEATSWWHGRIVAGLASYWVYQHLGNLSPRGRAADEVWRRIIGHEGQRNSTSPTCSTSSPSGATRIPTATAGATAVTSTTCG